ncbi:MAG: MFS transporter [Chloroflexi bacterium]|nr:MFS transporter [Chloroflexota bacterium]
MTVAAPREARLFTPAFAALSAAALAFFVAGGIFLPATPRYTVGPLGGDEVAVGIVIGAFAVSSLLMRPFAGRFADRGGRKIALVVGAVITVVAAAGHLAAVSIPLLIVMRLLFGVGEALFFVAALAAATDLAPEHRRGEAISLISISVYLGTAIGPLIGEAALAASGFAAVWLVAAAIAALSVGLSLLAPETLPPESRTGAGGGPDIPAPRQSLIHRRGIEPGLLVLCGVWGMGPFFAFIPLLADDLGLGSSGPYLAAFAIVVVGLRIVGARLPDQIGAAKLSGTALIVSAAGLLVSGIAVGGLVPVGAGLLVGTVVFAAGVAFTFPAIMAMAVVGVPPRERGAVVGTAGLFVDAAFGISPAILGLLASASGYPSTFLVSGGIALVGAVWLLARRPGAAIPVRVVEP